MSTIMPSADAVIAATATWVQQLIVKYNLCPYARAEVEAQRVRYVVAEEEQPAQLLQQLAAECQRLDAEPDIATTLLILPHGYADFDTYLDLLDAGNDLLQQTGYEGVYQLASFHPHYCFADSPASDPANFTNRSPYPMLHLLREQMITAVLGDSDAEATAAAIVRRNVEFSRRKGANFFMHILQHCAAAESRS